MKISRVVPRSLKAKATTVVASVAALSSLGMLPAIIGQAAATTNIRSNFTCSISGFTGNFRVQDDSVHGSGSTYYRIYKGSNTGGNNANVNLIDEGISNGGTFPSYSLATAIQDSHWHFYGAHASGAGKVQFIFDKSGASDPRCDGSLRWA